MTTGRNHNRAQGPEAPMQFTACNGFKSMSFTVHYRNTLNKSLERFFHSCEWVSNMWPAMAKPAASWLGRICVNQGRSVFLQNVEIMKKPLHVSDKNIGCLKSIHFVFEIEIEVSGKWCIWLVLCYDTVNFHTGYLWPFTCFCSFFEQSAAH